MTSWQQIHLAAAADALRAQRDLDLDVTHRIEPFEALVADGVTVFRRPLEGLAGAYIASDQSTTSPPGVIVNSNHPLSKQRYTAAHELGHHRRDGMTIVDQETDWVDRDGAPSVDRERGAEAFAAWFLMPRRLVTTLLQEMGIAAAILQPIHAYELALNLGVSYRAVVNHLGDMRLLADGLRRELLLATPRDIKISILGGPPPGDLHRDVHRVSPRQDRAVGLQGDLLVIEALEIPSSGYRWTLDRVPDGLSVQDERFQRQGPREELGNAGLRRFVVKLDEPLAAAVQLQLRQPWADGLTAEARTVAVTSEPKPHRGIVAPERMLLNHA